MSRAQKGIHERYSKVFPVKRRVIWFHVSSLGEFEQGKPVMEAWKAKYPEDFLLLTFYSPSGYEVRKGFKGADYVDYLPFDTARDLAKICEIVNPSRFVLVKYDIWPHLLEILFDQDVAVYLISALFTRDHHILGFFGSYFRGLLTQMERIFVQDEESMQLLRSKGIDRVSLAGDTRVDRVYELASNRESVEGIEAFVEASTVLIAGSTWEPEEKFLGRYVQEQISLFEQQDAKIIIAPHDVSESHISFIEKLFGQNSVRYSHFLQFPELKKGKRVLIIDQIGLLNRIYAYGEMAFVGGGFGRGLHNVLEPAAYGIPIIIGPRFSGFLEAKILIKMGGVLVAKNYSDITTMLTQYLINKRSFSLAGVACSDFIERSKGATSLIISSLVENG